MDRAVMRASHGNTTGTSTGTRRYSYSALGTPLAPRKRRTRPGFEPTTLASSPSARLARLLRTTSTSRRFPNPVVPALAPALGFFARAHREGRASSPRSSVRSSHGTFPSASSSSSSSDFCRRAAWTSTRPAPSSDGEGRGVDADESPANARGARVSSRDSLVYERAHAMVPSISRPLRSGERPDDLALTDVSCAPLSRGRGGARA